MKTSLLTLLAITHFLFQSAFAGTGIEEVSGSKIVQPLDSNDVQTAIRNLPDMEKLWPQQPLAYFQSAKQAAKILGGATDNPDATANLLNLFTNVIQKQLPTNEDLAIPCLEEKTGIILYYFNFKEVRSDKSRLVAIAKYIGEIRVQIISDFVPKTVYLNPPGAMDPSPEKVQQAIQENEQNKAINNFQRLLNAANTALTFHLLHDATQFRLNDPTNAIFIQNIKSAARWTPEELRQLQ